MVLSNLKNNLIKKIINKNCPVVHPLFNFAFSNDLLSKTHRQALYIRKKRKKSVQLTHYFLWPVFSLLLAFVGSNLKQINSSVEEIPRIRLFYLLWVALCFHNLTMSSFIKFRIWLPKNKKRINEYIQHHEIVELLPWLNRHKDVKNIDNKILFETLCNTYNIPTANIIAKIIDNKIIMNEKELPKIDLFSKFDDLWCGIGAEAWNYKNSNSSWENNGAYFQEDELLQHFLNKAKKMPLIVQPKLTNSQAIANLSSGALCTFRIVTFKFKKQRAVHYTSVLRMPTGNSCVDNFDLGGIAAGITAAGVLKSAIAKYDSYAYLNKHPDTHASILGHKLECIKEIIELALNTHDLISNVYSIGWDIAWTQKGAIVIEANMGWCADLIQMANARPLGQQFCNLLWCAENENISN